MTATQPEHCQPPQPPPWRMHATLPKSGALLTAPRTAREHVREVLTRWGLSHHIEIAELITSELVTNVARQAFDDATGDRLAPGAPLPLFELRLFSDASRLLIVVWDNAPGWPAERHASDQDESGRGLEMVSELAELTWHRVRDGKIARVVLGAATCGESR
jgi:anti-sigma regulatory factor (Ser/Thr protein kinase)